MGIVFIWAQTYKEAFKVALVYLSGGGGGGARWGGVRGVCGNAAGGGGVGCVGWGSRGGGGECGGGGTRRWVVSPSGSEIFLIIPNFPRSTRKQSLLY